MAYIGATGTSGGAAAPAPCVFCDCLTRDDDRSALMLLRAPLAFLILNAYPYASGHVMAVVNRHVGTLGDATEAELAEMMGLVVRATALLQAEYRADGFNIGLNQGRIAGAGVEGHLHVHVVPRWSGDHNFMSTVGAVRVLPEALSATWERLKKRLDA